jgi:hypothetical protein
MRYSRFKKQMEGTNAPKKPRAPKSPSKAKVEKKAPPPKKVKKRSDSEAEKIKEEAGVAGSSHHTPVEGTPEAGLQPDSYHSSIDGSPFVKREPGSSNGSRYPSTPLEAPLTPGSSFNGTGDLDDMGEMLNSFDMPGGDMYEPMMGQDVMAHPQYLVGMDMGLADSYAPYNWEPQQIQGEEGVLVKREPRWEPTYHQA